MLGLRKLIKEYKQAKQGMQESERLSREQKQGEQALAEELKSMVDAEYPGSSLTGPQIRSLANRAKHMSPSEIKDQVADAESLLPHFSKAQMKSLESQAKHMSKSEIESRMAKADSENAPLFNKMAHDIINRP